MTITPSQGSGHPLPRPSNAARARRSDQAHDFPSQPVVPSRQASPSPDTGARKSGTVPPIDPAMLHRIYGYPSPADVDEAIDDANWREFYAPLIGATAAVTLLLGVLLTVLA